MKPSSLQDLRRYGSVLGLTIILIVLAILQYRSSKQISQANSAQMLTALEGSLSDLRQGVESELNPICRDFQWNETSSVSHALPDYAQDWRRWRTSAPHPNLVSNLYVVDGSPAPSAKVRKVSIERGEPENVPWPDSLASLAGTLQEVESQAGEPRGPEEPGHPGFEGHGPHPDAGPNSGWIFEPSIPALLHPLPPSERSRPDPQPPFPSWLVIQLNREVLTQHVLPELVRRYFGSQERSTYDIAVLGDNSDLIFSSDPKFGSDAARGADASLNFFGRPVLTAGYSSAGGKLQPGFIGPRLPDPPPAQNGFRHEGPIRIEPIRRSAGESGWTAFARHRTGSLEAASAAIYHRDLAINFGVLAVLAGTIAMVIMASQRARKLAQLQMDFVASVSHELRTPLTGIISAAQNIADGLVTGPERTTRYGAAILSQAEQLTELVEQILLFSATQKGLYRYRLSSFDVSEAIEASLKQTASLIKSSGIVLEKQIEPDLPEVSADRKALTHCIQNLIVNAVKYGGEGRWIGLRATTTNGSDGNREVRITVADKGIGIEPQDLNKIFDPFYRTEEAAAAQIHGSGLGLAVARSVVEAMGGRLTVESVRRQGSAFTVHLPASTETPASRQHLIAQAERAK